jgi:c-di-GMP-related signal transduction protein
MTTDIPALKLACLQLLQELRRPMLDLLKLEEIVKAQPSFCYRLLRYLNSAAFFGLPTVTSIRHAMALLGDQDLRRMLTLMAAVASSDGQPSEIVFMSMLRARLCELLSPEFPEHGFMTGLFSLMPMIVNMPLSAMLSVVHLPSPVDKALWGQPGALRMVLDLTVSPMSADSGKSCENWQTGCDSLPSKFLPPAARLPVGLTRSWRQPAKRRFPLRRKPTVK